MNTFQKVSIILVELIVLLLLAIGNAYAEVTEANAEETVKNAPCVDGKTIEDALKDKIKMRSQRDLGWQVFNEDGKIEVERAFLMNKSMQLRFRWRINPDGSVTPISGRAESLCTNQSSENE